MRQLILLLIVVSVTAYHPFRFKSKVDVDKECDGPVVGVGDGSVEHCKVKPPKLPRPDGSSKPKGVRASNRGEHGWRMSKGDLLTEYDKGTSKEFKDAQPPSANKCANLQSSCKCGGEGVTDPNTAVDILLKDAATYDPIFAKLMNQLVDAAERHETDDRFVFTKPEISTAPVKGKARCIEKIKQKYGCPGLKGCRQLTDVVRGSLIFEDEQSICFFLSNVINAKDGVICDTTNDVTPPGECASCFDKDQFFCKDGAGYCVSTKNGRAECKNDATMIKQVVGCDKPMCEDLGLSKVSVRFAKNRFDRDAEGMRDYLVNIHMQKSDDMAGHVAELQIHHKRQVEAKHIFHCVYAYVRRIQEARTMMKIEPADIFCDDEKCKQYWIDTKHPKKNNKTGKEEQKSALDIMYEKWVKFDDDGTQDAIGKNIWDTKIAPYLEKKDCKDDCKIKGRKPGEKIDVVKMLELQIFTGLADKMTEEYDIATLPSQIGQPYEEPMFQGEECTINLIAQTAEQRCPEDVKCKCTQRQQLEFEDDDKDCTNPMCK